ncbi:lycopene cyclase domain-containing protein [Paeniglutamicibacter antarcticus]|uniref:Lycopene cyclase domain-containing protein n=1 Tax=Arthrobacter terrae TaxID=2935737 RepID=A0A931G4W6_9MICC|nr:lycopene cyclase domain-containing protein [Arthrobacter terrae]MBG0740186.1 lycopene cyclase domain-containing protein [Arthrobacter terrae]
MTYWALNVIFLLAAGAVALGIGLFLRNLRPRSGVQHTGPRDSALQDSEPRRRTGKMCMAAAAVSAAVLLLLTAVFDNVMISAGLFGYGADKISGPMIGRMPLEDFAYPLGAVLLLPALWLLFNRGSSTAADREEAHD